MWLAQVRILLDHLPDSIKTTKNNLAPPQIHFTHVTGNITPHFLPSIVFGCQKTPLVNFVTKYADRLQATGMTVTTRQFAEDDHFLFFRKRDEVLEELANWLRNLTPSAPSPVSRD